MYAFYNLKDYIDNIKNDDVDHITTTYELKTGQQEETRWKISQ